MEIWHYDEKRKTAKLPELHARDTCAFGIKRNIAYIHEMAHALKDADAHPNNSTAG